MNTKFVVLVLVGMIGILSLGTGTNGASLRYQFSATPSGTSSPKNATPTPEEMSSIPERDDANLVLSVSCLGLSGVVFTIFSDPTERPGRGRPGAAANIFYTISDSTNMVALEKSKIDGLPVGGIVEFKPYPIGSRITIEYFGQVENVTNEYEAIGFCPF